MKSFLSLLILIFAFNCYGQESCPTTSSNRTTGVFRVSNMDRPSQSSRSCTKSNHAGVIVALQYYEEDPEVVQSIVIALESGQRLRIYLGTAPFVDCFSNAERGVWNERLKKGTKVKAVAYRCGASGSSPYVADNIEFSPVAKPKRK